MTSASRSGVKRPAIVFDIEVAGLPWEDVDETTRTYLLNRERDPNKRDAIPERTGLYPGFGKVIAIGLWLVDEERGLMLLEGEPVAEQPWDLAPGARIFRGNEGALLQRFWEIVEQRSSRLVTYNGRSYDGPMLMVRSAQLGIAPSRNLTPYRYDVSDHCDLLDILGFQGAASGRYSLDYWCRRFDVASPKGSIDGSQVAGAYQEGRIDEIGEYCLRDVRATAQLYSKLEPTLLPLFKGY